MLVISQLDLNPAFHITCTSFCPYVFPVRPAVIAALRSTWWPELRRFMVTPVLRAVDNDEPMDFLTEIRNVVVVFLNIKTQTVTEHVLISIVDSVFKTVCKLVMFY